MHRLSTCGQRAAQRGGCIPGPEQDHYPAGGFRPCLFSFEHHKRSHVRLRKCSSPHLQPPKVAPLRLHADPSVSPHRCPVSALAGTFCAVVRGSSTLPRLALCVEACAWCPPSVPVWYPCPPSVPVWYPCPPSDPRAPPSAPTNPRTRRTGMDALTTGRCWPGTKGAGGPQWVPCTPRGRASRSKRPGASGGHWSWSLRCPAIHPCPL